MPSAQIHQTVHIAGQVQVLIRVERICDEHLRAERAPAIERIMPFVVELEAALCDPAIPGHGFAGAHDVHAIGPLALPCLPEVLEDLDQRRLIAALDRLVEMFERLMDALAEECFDAFARRKLDLIHVPEPVLERAVLVRVEAGIREGRHEVPV